MMMSDSNVCGLVLLALLLTADMTRSYSFLERVFRQLWVDTLSLL